MDFPQGKFDYETWTSRFIHLCSQDNQRENSSTLLAHNGKNLGSHSRFLQCKS